MIKEYIRSYKDFPVKGIDFKDTSSLCNSKGFNIANNFMYSELLKYMPCDKIVGIDARGFIFASVLASRTRQPLVLCRKQGKLPGPTVSKEFDLEYGTDKLEIQSDAISRGDRIIIVDDLMATGGTMCAVIDMIKEFNAEVVAVSCVINLNTLGGADKMHEQKIPFYAAVEY